MRTVTTLPADLDHLAHQAIDRSQGCMVNWYLMTSYLYYLHDKSVLTDTFYDAMCKDLKHAIGYGIKAVVEHPHFKHIDVEALKAGTAFHLKEEDYPGVVKGAARHLLTLCDC